MSPSVAALSLSGPSAGVGLVGTVSATLTSVFSGDPVGADCLSAAMSHSVTGGRPMTSSFINVTSTVLSASVKACPDMHAKRSVLSVGASTGTTPAAVTAGLSSQSVV